MKLLGFFVIETTFLFFDEKYLHVYFPEKEDYHTSGIEETLQISPMRYFMNSLKDRQSESITNFLIYQEDDYRFGITRVFSKDSYYQI